MRRVLHLLFLWLLLGGASAAHAQDPSALDAQVELKAGDMLRVEVWRQPELSGDIEVAEDGSLVHPLYREVSVVDVPLPLVEERLREVINRFETGSYFVINPLIRVSVGGGVRSPNLYSFSPSTTVGQAVALAGGPTGTGRLDRTRLLREGQTYVLDLRRPEEGNVRVRSGDQIILGERGPSIFQNVIVPLVSFVAATASVVNIFL